MSQQTISFLVVQFLNGLAYSLLLFLVAAGLSLIFGLMDVINLAHGAFYMVGAYLGLSVARAVGSFWIALIVSPLIIGVMGLLLEAGLLRPIYARGHLDQVLLTFGLAFIFMDLTRWIWGGNVLSFPAPPGLTDSVSLMGAVFPKYRLFVIAMGLLLAAGLWMLVERTRLGAIVRAGVTDRELVRGFGIPIALVLGLVFAAGAALAALSGVIAAPIVSLAPGMDFSTLLVALIVVVAGGLGTLKGAFWGSLLIGEAQTFGQALFPDLALFLIFAIMAAVLMIKPSGLFGASEG